MNSNMNKAKKAKNDEFYTKYETVEKELVNYKSQLENKIIYCNCDDYRVSNFYKYFKDNFENLKLKQLIATNYDIGSGSYKCIYDGKEEKVSKLEGNGDFRSKECIELLDYSDIVITNPPFSLFRDFISTLTEYNKKFLVVGNYGSVIYKKIFPLIKDDKLWLGYNAPKKFKQPDGGEKNFGNITWFTNLTTKKRLDFIPLTKSYYDNIDEYPKYVNFNGIEVSRVTDIPMDYEGYMGVPITFLAKYNTEQFELIGHSLDLAESMDKFAEKGEFMQGGHKFYLKEQDKEYKYRRLYDRIIIKNKKVIK